MSEEELIRALREMDKKKVEELEEPSKSLFNTIMYIADKRDKSEERVAYLERSNNRREETILDLRLEQQLDKYKEVIEEVREWLKYKAEALDKFDIPKRKETGAFWFSTRGEIDNLLQILDKVKEK